MEYVYDTIHSVTRIDIDYHEKKCHKIKNIPDLLVCETCGCYIAPGFAISGNQEIRHNQCGARTLNMSLNGDYFYTKEGHDYIYTPYYCKVHAPKVKK